MKKRAFIKIGILMLISLMALIGCQQNDKKMVQRTKMDKRI